MDAKRLEGLRSLHVEFEDFQEIDERQIMRQKAGPVEHVRITGLPCLGATHASLSGGQIHLAPVLGQRLGEASGIRLVHGGIATQAYRCCQILEQVLLACGSSVHQMVRLSCYVSNLGSNTSQVLSEVIDLFCHERSCHNITRTIIGCDRLQGDAAVQMEGVAAVPDSRTLQTPPRSGHGNVRSAVSSEKTRAKGKHLSSDIFLVGDDCEAAAAAAAAATAAVLEEEPESWIVVNDAEDIIATTGSSRLENRFLEVKEIVERKPLTPGAVEKPPMESPAVPLSVSGFYGHTSSFELQALSQEEAESIHPGLGKDFTRFCRMTMKGPEDYRTLRLEPGIIQCQPAEAWHAGRWKPPMGSTWSFTFALAVEKTANCFVNVGLVEWVAARQDGEQEGGSKKQSLSQIMKVKSEDEDNVPGGWLPEQHVHENPKQMMLGCRKGVQWFGNAAKFPLFQDNIMEGSLLRFRCDYHLNRQGEIAQVKIWFLPSPVCFEYGGDHTLTEADLWFEPLAQWWEPRCQDKKMRSLWVPAVTMYTCEDVVTVAWNG